MPPRLPGRQGLCRSLTSACVRPTAPNNGAPSFQPLIQKAHLSKEKKRLMKQDPYAWEAREARKMVNVKRQAELAAQRALAFGSPVHGLTTPFLESLDSGGQAARSRVPLDDKGQPVGEGHALPTSLHIKNYLLTQEELDRALEQSYVLTKPLPAENASLADPLDEAAKAAAHEERHARATIALRRIADLDNGSAKDRKHANIRRIIETFGRHNTDRTVPRAAPPPVPGLEPVPKPERAGPDTGSSEVQIAILTSKIRALATKLEGPKGHRDKNNKRSLRLLCHKRQKLLKYMEKKERGSGRWHHMIETLGLSPATWKEQISL